MTKKFKIWFIIAGVLSTIWFIWRVVQKPSRIHYPCMQATAPIMSAFLLWISGSVTAIFSIKKAKIAFSESRYPLFAALMLIGFVGGVIALTTPVIESYANFASDVPRVPELLDDRNMPIGEGYGIFNGRVVWVYDNVATNENCTNVSGDYWFEDKNTDQETVNNMLAEGICKLTGEATVQEAWDALFTYHNKKMGRGYHGYLEGEKVAIKINLTNSSYLGFDSNDKMDATPQLVFALLDQLVNEMGIPQSNITIGDPFRTFRDIYWDKCHTAFPDVMYIDNKGEKGRILTEVTPNDEYYTSDGSFSSPIPKAYKEADYFINIPCLKSHSASGISITAKNHQGSVLGTGQTARNQQMGKDLHYCFPSNIGYYEMNNYRHLVDYMGNRYMGGNTVLYIVDALWTGHDWNGVVMPWQMEPFNGDWMSSLFLSQDAVAIESVGFDFLFEEYLAHSDLRGGDFPLYEATQDYIHQAADPANWPTNIVYDPENDGTPLQSLGVHEHWNDVKNKQYTGNLGEPGGIHLVSLPSTLVAGSEIEYEKDTTSNIDVSMSLLEKIDMKIYPNPTSGRIQISFDLKHPAEIILSLFNINGQKVADIERVYFSGGHFSNVYDLDPYHLSEGLYIYRLQAESQKETRSNSGRIQILK